MVGRLRFIAQAESVTCDEATLSQLILSSEGDMRRAIQVRRTRSQPARPSRTTGMHD